MPTPIFIIGAARNGTTSLGNMVATSSEVACAEHWLHSGGDESNILGNKNYWGSLSDPNAYDEFLRQYATSDYFRLCRGDVAFHLKHRARGFFPFFLDLMDRFAGLEGRKFWITKLDPAFFVHHAELEGFLALLSSRYQEVKFLRIRRDPIRAFASYLRMPGHRRHLRRRPWLLMPALVLYLARYAATYSRGVIDQRYDVLDLRFESYVADRARSRERVFGFLGIEPCGGENQPERFPVNSSFEGPRPAVPNVLQAAVRFGSAAFAAFPPVARFLARLGAWVLPPGEPFSRRLHMYQSNRNQLLDELRDRGESALIRALEEREAARGISQPQQQVEQRFRRAG